MFRRPRNGRRSRKRKHKIKRKLLKRRLRRTRTINLLKIRLLVLIRPWRRKALL